MRATPTPSGRKEDTGPSHVKLSRGRHPLTQQAVAESQRARLLAAVAQVVAGKGFAGATVADVIALAGVSRRTFYEFYPSIEDCFLAAYEQDMRALFRAIDDAVARCARDDWRARAHATLEAYLRELARLPDAARAYTVEAFGAGRRALALRTWVVDRWVAQWRALDTLRRGTSSKVSDPSRWLALIGGVDELVRDCLQKSGASQLPGLLEPANRFVLAVLDAEDVAGAPVPGSFGMT